MLLDDTERNALIYVKRTGSCYLGVVVGRENPQYIYTVQPMSEGSIEGAERYIKLYERQAKD